MQVLKNLLNSEKAVATGALILGATYLTATGQIPVSEWLSYSKALAGIYVGGKGLQGAGAAIGKSLEKRASKEKDELKTQIDEQNKKIDELVKGLPKAEK